MTDQPATPLTEQQLDAIQARTNAATDGPWTLHEDEGDTFQAPAWEVLPASGEMVARVRDWASADAEFIAHAREDVPALVAALRDSRAEVEKLARWHREDETALKEMRGTIEGLRAGLTEMTHCRDNALRALNRDDVETDIDLEETIAAPFYGPGWDWNEVDLQQVVKEAADAVRPAFGKLTQQCDAVIALLDQQELAARAFEVPLPEWVTAVRGALRPAAVAAAGDTDEASA